MPFPMQFPEGGGSAGGTFYGDYAGLDAATNANPLWSDTRNPDLFACRDASSGQVTLPPSVCGQDEQHQAERPGHLHRERRCPVHRLARGRGSLPVFAGGRYGGPQLLP
jgi:hypothetical protein